MDETTREELRRKMAEAAALPAHDPHRIGVAREVVDAGEWAEAEWLELIDSDIEDVLSTTPYAGAPRTRHRQARQSP